MLVSALALALLQSQSAAAQTAQTEDRPITYDANAIPMRQVMTDLTRLTGQHLEAVNEVLSDRLILHFEGAKASDVLKRMSDVTYGIWETADGGLRLRRDPVKVAANAKRVHALNLKDIEHAFAAFRKALAKKATFDADKAKALAQSLNRLNRQNNNGNVNYWQAQNEVQQSLPLGRAMERLLLTLSPELILDVPPSSRVVLSSQPTSMEYGLPDTSLSAINSLIEEQQVWAAAAQQYIAAQEGPVVDYFGGTSKKSFKNATRALLSLSRYGTGFGVTAELQIADAKGHVLGTAQSGFYPGSYGEESDPAAAYKPPTKEETAANPPLPLSARAAAVAGLFSWDNRTPKPIDAQTDAFKAICQPTRFDPASLVFGEGLLTMAKAHHENLVVLADDGMAMMPNFFTEKGKFTQANLRLRNLPYLPMEWKIDNGWYIAAPKDMTSYATGQSDRESLEAILTELRQTGKISIDLLANYAARSSDQFGQQLAMAYSNAIQRGSGQILQQNDWDTLRFYGSLSDGQRESKANQLFGSLSSEQKALANKLVFGMYSRLNITAESGMDQAFSAVEGTMFGDLSREPTEALPNGIPDRAYFTVKRQDDQIILAETQYSEWYQGLQMQEPESLSWMVYQTQHPSGNDNWKILNMQAANRHQVMIDFQLAPKTSQMMTLVECKPIGSPSADSKGLPQAMRDKLDKAVAEMAKNMQNGNMVIETGGGGPPTGQP